MLYVGLEIHLWFFEYHVIYPLVYVFELCCKMQVLKLMEGQHDLKIIELIFFRGV